jgi:hypothetical protein
LRSSDAVKDQFVLRVVGTGRRSRSKVLVAGINLLTVTGMVLGFAIFVADVAKMEIAHPRAPQVRLPDTALGRAAVEENWKSVEPRLARRLKLKRLELGAVWATRTGKICGLVNGWGGFGGLVGMTRFYTDDQGFGFSVNPPADFYAHWDQCEADHWLILHPGSEEQGFCGTRLGRKRCWVVGQPPVP